MIAMFGDEEETREKIDPWGSRAITDYSHIYTDFSISTITPEAKAFFADKTFLFERDIIIGERNLGEIVDLIRKKDDFAIVSGFATSGDLHYGHKAVIDVYKFFRQYTKRGYFAICDLDAYVSRPDAKIPSLAASQEYAVRDVADVLALGVSERDIVVQSGRDAGYYDFAFQVSKKLTLNTMKATLGHTDLGKFSAAYLQIADILYPQVENGGMPTLVPAGIDQEPLLRLTRDVARKFKSTYDLTVPSSVYIAHLPSLQDFTDKMSKSKENSALMLTSSEQEMEKVVSNAITGGRETTEEQRKFGGNPQKCSIYDMYKFNHPDSAFVKGVCDRCVSGQLLCGEDKKVLKEFLRQDLKEHAKGRDEFLERARKIVIKK
ncbi:Tryptophan--tRNA ligase [uncultured archaeon]|nr:Tryptophan--tRNA ligase [uncultured archaeon]